jgi:serine/threonine-protein kinase
MSVRQSSKRDRHSTLRRGDRVHKYRIEKLIGSGGFAEVYKAYDTVEGLYVALKIITGMSSAENVFRNEARIIARLDHPNITRLKTAEILGKRLVLVTELGERTLSDVYERSRPTRYSLHVLDHVLQGLAYAHSQGVLHRDVKPDNILVWRDGRVKLTDFGISKIIEKPIIYTTVTGTPSYRAPEQAYGRPTFASDVFSLALMFYEMVTRVLPRWPFRWPFERHEVFEERVPRPLVRVIRRAASFDLQHRYRDAGALLRAVHKAIPEFADGSDKPTLKAPERRIGWREYRMQEFEKRHGKLLHLDFRCHDCAGPISEYMRTCPWCGSERNSFHGVTRFPSVCVRCEHGVYDDWNYCPWCFGAGFPVVSHVPSRDPMYHGRCTRCGETRLLPHMRFCPWCNARLRPWRSRKLPDRCPGCKNSVDFDHWDWCPWCSRNLQLLQSSGNGRRSG